jgi:hypothetical protein
MAQAVKMGFNNFSRIPTVSLIASISADMDNDDGTPRDIHILVVAAQHRCYDLFELVFKKLRGTWGQSDTPYGFQEGFEKANIRGWPLALIRELPKDFIWALFRPTQSISDHPNVRRVWCAEILKITGLLECPGRVVESESVVWRVIQR